jgi:drug/metabolite transporter (DMT)-like permease
VDKLIVILLMVLDCAIGSAGALLLKKSAGKVNLNLRPKKIISTIKNAISHTNFVLSIIFYCLGAALLTFLLKTENLSLIYPLTSMTYIFIVILSYKFLNEKMNKYKWTAVFLIIVGNIFITI